MKIPETVAELQREWPITVGAPYAGGTEAYIARAVAADRIAELYG
jgi:hypothetical protein